MNILFTLLAAFPIGFFVRQRAVAVIAYLAAEAFVFTFQTLDVLLNWMGGNGGIGGEKAFGAFPTGFPINYDASQIYAYGLVNLVIALVGIGLNILGNRIATKRAAKKNVVAVG
jgi:hypothetical protein